MLGFPGPAPLMPGTVQDVVSDAQVSLSYAAKKQNAKSILFSTGAKVGPS